LTETVKVLSVDEACDRYLPELVNRVCSSCPIKHLCPQQNPEDPFPDGCQALKILERLFLVGKLSFRDATVPAELPENGGLKVFYDLDGF